MEIEPRHEETYNDGYTKGWKAAFAVIRALLKISAMRMSKDGRDTLGAILKALDEME